MLEGKKIAISVDAGTLLAIISTVVREKIKLNRVPDYCLDIEAWEAWDGDLIDMHIAAIELQLAGLITIGRTLNQQYYKTNVDDVEFIQELPDGGTHDKE